MVRVQNSHDMPAVRGRLSGFSLRGQNDMNTWSILKCLHVGSPSFPHDLITLIYCMFLSKFCLGTFCIFYLILFFSPVFFIFSYLPCWLEYCKWGVLVRQLVWFRRKVLCLRACMHLCACVCACVCVYYLLSHSHYFSSWIHTSWGGRVHQETKSMLAIRWGSLLSAILSEAINGNVCGLGAC